MDQPVRFYLPLLLTVAGSVLYHLAQRTMPTGVSPFAPLLAAFATAVALCAVVLVTTRQMPARLSQVVSRSSLALGLAVVMIELGFLLAYRQGWRLNRASLVSNVVVALLLVPVGAALFREQVSPRMLIGVLLCVAGLLLLAGAPAIP